MSRKPYPTDLTEKQQTVIAPLLLSYEGLGRTRKYLLTEILNAVLYIELV